MDILTSIAVLGVYSLKQTAKTKYCATVRGGFTSASFKNYRLPTLIVSALVSAGNPAKWIQGLKSGSQWMIG